MYSSTSLNTRPLYHLAKSLAALASTLMLALALLSPQAQADTPTGNTPPAASDMHDMHSMDSMDGHESHHQRMADELKLTDSQRAAFKNVMEQMRKTFHSGRDLHEQIRDITESDNYDEKKIRDLIHKHNIEMENNIVSDSKAMHDFYQSLSPEQKTKFNEMRNRMKDRMKQHMRDHMKDRMDKDGDDWHSGPED